MSSDDNLSKKTKSMNQSGAFLQIHIINELKKRNWTVLAEYPIRISPFLDLPAKQPILYTRLLNHLDVEPISFVRAARESMDKTTVKETSIDVIGERIINDDYCFNLCIESKKLDPRFIDWVFFQQTKHENTLRFLMRQHFIKKPVLLKTPKTTKNKETYLTINTIQGELDYPVCDFALSLKSEEVDREYYKSDKTKVDDASRQIIEGTYGFIVDRIFQHVLKGDPQMNRGLTDCFIPLVVTNANLFICEFDENEIDSKSGKIKNEPTYKPVDSLIYECPAPKSVQFPEPLEADSTPEENNAITKWHVLVLSPKGFSEFLQKFGRKSQ
ncbi:MAG: hypothetical protein IH841_07215 [Thaumarchaeota archaeon]|nr:hypothetical protein [Nitrososphaerota archaeon]